MDLEQIQYLRKEMEVEVINILHKFEITTKTTVTAVELYHSKEIGSRNGRVASISIKAEI